MNKSHCLSCNAGCAKRDCPALGGPICGACCGSKRNSSIKCTAECPMNPFGVNNYDEWLKLDGSWGNKCIRYVRDKYPHDEYSFKSELNKYVLIDGAKDEFTIAEAAPIFMYAKLFWEPFRDEKCLADYWEREGWRGLSNDERVMMGYRRKTVPAIVEIQEKITDFSSRCIDLLAPDAAPFIVFDRTLVARYDRFSRSLSLICRYPYYYRVGPSGIELQHELTDAFIGEIKARSVKHGLTVRDYLAVHYVESCRYAHELGRERYKNMVDSLDLSEWTAVYKLNISRGEIAKVLSLKPEFEQEDNETEEVMEYLWVRRGESKKLEKKMPDAFRHHDESLGVGTLGTLRLLADSLEVIALGSQKFRFARKMIEKYLGACIAFQMETEHNLKDEQGKREDERNERDVAPGGKEEMEEEDEIPPEIKAELMTKFYEQHYKDFIDSPVPVLYDKTPRQAAKSKELRPKLIDLMKQHLHEIEKRNREVPYLDLSIDWMVDELGLEELKKGRST
jgi:hypothetical protein